MGDEKLDDMVIDSECPGAGTLQHKLTLCLATRPATIGRLFAARTSMNRLLGR